MDILKPQTVMVGGRRYRKSYAASDGTTGCQGYQQHTYQDFSNWDDEDCQDEQILSIQKTDRGYKGYCTDIPSYYFKFIIGRKNESKNRIEKETKTRIAIPRPGNEGDIVITGPERSGVVSAKSRIELIIESARSRTRPTHFVSIPLASDAVKQQFDVFKQTVLQECSECNGFDEEILQIPEKLHLTMGMMTLMSEQEIGKAATFLKRIQEDIQREFIGENPLKVVLEGIESMNDDPSQVVVLYAKVRLADGTDRLQRMADYIVEQFSAAGLMKKEYDRVKLHATVINTNFICIEENESKDHKTNVFQNKSRKKVSFFDARKLFQICEGFKFGEVDVTAIHLSKRGDYGSDGYYHCEAYIDL